jgi:hypothetical protein
MRLNIVVILLIIGLESNSIGSPKEWQPVLNLPVSYRMGTLDGKETSNFYLGLGLDLGRAGSLTQLHMEIHSYMGPFMFADMNQPNEIDLGPQLTIHLDRNRELALTVSAGPALFLSSNGSLSLHKYGGYICSALLISSAKSFRWGPFSQYSKGKTDMQFTDDRFGVVWTEGFYLGVVIQYAMNL